MTQTENAPSSDPMSREELAKKDLLSLELLLEISERNLESTILERNKKTKELLELDRAFRSESRESHNDPIENSLMEACRKAGHEQHELNLEIRRGNNQLLDIREAIVEKRNPL